MINARENNIRAHSICIYLEDWHWRTYGYHIFKMLVVEGREDSSPSVMKGTLVTLSISWQIRTQLQHSKSRVVRRLSWTIPSLVKTPRRENPIGTEREGKTGFLLRRHQPNNGMALLRTFEGKLSINDVGNYSSEIEGTGDRRWEQMDRDGEKIK